MKKHKQYNLFGTKEDFLFISLNGLREKVALSVHKSNKMEMFELIWLNDLRESVRREIMTQSILYKR